MNNRKWVPAKAAGWSKGPLSMSLRGPGEDCYLWAPQLDSDAGWGSIQSIKWIKWIICFIQVNWTQINTNNLRPLYIKSFAYLHLDDTHTSNHGTGWDGPGCPALRKPALSTPSWKTGEVGQQQPHHGVLVGDGAYGCIMPGFSSQEVLL